MEAKSRHDHSYWNVKNQLTQLKLPDPKLGKSVHIIKRLLRKISSAAPVAERFRSLFLNHSIISPLCLVWVRVPL